MRMAQPLPAFRTPLMNQKPETTSNERKTQIRTEVSQLARRARRPDFHARQMAVLVSDAAYIFRVESHFNRVDLRKRRQVTRLRRRDHVERGRLARLAMRGHFALQRFEGCAAGARGFSSGFVHPLLCYRPFLLFAVGAGSLDDASITGSQIRSERDQLQ